MADTLKGTRMDSTKYKKGQKSGPGRPKGSGNKIPAELKAMILEALDESGGVNYLVKQAKQRNPAAFMALLGKVLPMTVQGAGQNGEHELVFRWKSEK